MSDKPRTRATVEPLAATQDQIEQQKRVILATRSTVGQLLASLDGLAAQQETYNRLGLADDAILSDEAFAGTGTDKATYRAAIVSIDALFTLLEQGHGTNLEKFAR
jgi:hypothetical protein